MGENKQEHEVLCGLFASAREKNKYNLPEAQSTQRCLGLKKLLYEFLGDLDAFAREKKQINSRQGAKYAKVFWVRTKKNTKFSAASAPLREKINIIPQRRRVRRGVWDKNKPNIEVLGDLGAFAREK